AASLAGDLPEDVLQLLERNIAGYSSPARDLEEERAQHVASLRFHAILAEQARNPLLGFVIDFMVKLLSDLTVYRRLYSPPNIELWQQGHDHQKALVKALRNGNADRARAIMTDHMETAWKLMRRQEVEVQNRFISE
ncbi:MAG: FCD domain-containing protein, partial [Boseongicola sp. SB0676_bin_33]|nr:FCD domain-containing protein [Boseongicola sp. SB0676_bin_33]